MITPPRGWHGRGYLPHYDSPHEVQHVVFRLHGSLPRRLIETVDPAASKADRRATIDAALDRGQGPRWLAEPAIADDVVSTLRHFDRDRYGLLAWCVMPNHVHVVVSQHETHSLAQVVQGWKTFTARAANRRLARTGPFWAPDYFDRFARDDSEVAAMAAYVEANPVKAGLCERAEDWPWSSASLRHAAAAAACADEDVRGPLTATSREAG